MRDRAVRTLSAPSAEIRAFVRGALPHPSSVRVSPEDKFRFSALRDGLCVRHVRTGEQEERAESAPNTTADGLASTGVGARGDRIGIARMDLLTSLSVQAEDVLSHPSCSIKWHSRLRVRHYELQDKVPTLDYSALPNATNKRFQAIEDHNARLIHSYNITKVPTIFIVDSSGHVTWRGTGGWLDGSDQGRTSVKSANP